MKEQPTPIEFAWPHLLYIQGEAADYERIAEMIARYDPFPLGPLCWLLREAPDRDRLAAELAAVTKKENHESEIFLCALSPVWYHNGRHSFELTDWLGRARWKE